MMLAKPPEEIPENQIAVNELVLKKIEKLAQKKTLSLDENLLLLRVMLTHEGDKKKLDLEKLFKDFYPPTLEEVISFLRAKLEKEVRENKSVETYRLQLLALEVITKSLSLELLEDVAKCAGRLKSSFDLEAKIVLL